MRFLLPKDNTFFNFLQRSNRILRDISELLAGLSANFKDFKSYSRKAKDLEHEGDENAHETINWLNKTFIIPFDREDIHVLALECDDIIDLIEEVIHNLELYQLPARPEELLRFSEIIVEDAHYLGKLLDCLAQSKYDAHAREMVIKIHELEDQGDTLYYDSLREIFAKNKDAVKVIKLKVILDGLESVTDKFQKVSDIIEGILVKFN